MSSLIEQIKEIAKLKLEIIDRVSGREDEEEMVNYLNGTPTLSELKELHQSLISENAGAKTATYKKLFVAESIEEAKQQAQEYITNVLIPLITENVRLYKTSQDRQDLFLLVNEKITTQNSLFDFYSGLTDLADRLEAYSIPTNVYVKLKSGGKPEKIEVLKQWKKSLYTQDRRIDKIEPKPGGDRILGSTFNPFRDTTVQPVECSEDEVRPILDHLEQNICGGNKELSEYFLNWIAHMFQKPASLPKVAISLFTEQEGNGKNIPIDLLARCLGSSQVNTDVSPEDTRNFTGPICGKTLLIFNESTFAGDHQQNATMLKLITEPYMRMRLMNREAIPVPNWARTITMTNNRTSGNSAKVGTRRWLTLECREEVEPAYLRKLANQIGNNGKNDEYIPDFEGKFVYYMKNRDISKFVPSQLPAQLSGMDTKINNTYRQNAMMAFIIEWLRDSSLSVYTTKLYDNREVEEIAVPWCRKLRLTLITQSLADNIKANPGSVPVAKNKISKELERYGFEIRAGAGNVRYAYLPHPAKALEVVRQISRSDMIVSPEQEELINTFMFADENSKMEYIADAMRIVESHQCLN